jgi:hypothetical protein
MDNIVDICQRIETKKRQEKAEKHRDKLEAIQKVIQCSGCHFRCAMCGHHTNAKGASKDPRSPSLSFTLCETCKEEFEDYLSVRQEEKAPGVSWHNREWIDMWSAWLNYRRAIQGFVNSSEFRQLMEDLNP